MGGVISQIDEHIQNYFDYGLISNCPNCNSRTILSYPTTQCTKCQNRFTNDIIVVDVYTQHGWYGNKRTIKQYGKANKSIINN